MCLRIIAVLVLLICKASVIPFIQYPQVNSEFALNPWPQMKLSQLQYHISSWWITVASFNTVGEKDLCAGEVRC